MDTVTENKRLARLWLALVSQARIEALCAITAPGWRMHGGPPSLPPGPDGIRALFRAFGPIAQSWSIEAMLAEDDMVAVRAWNLCVQDSFLGIPAEGRRQRFSATFLFRISNGLVQEIWRNADDLDRLRQIGARIVAADHEPGASARSGGMIEAGLPTPPPQP